jgi:hypothetical protein
MSGRLRAEKPQRKHHGIGIANVGDPATLIGVQDDRQRRWPGGGPHGSLSRAWLYAMARSELLTGPGMGRKILKMQHFLFIPK